MATFCMIKLEFPVFLVDNSIGNPEAAENTIAWSYE